MVTRYALLEKQKQMQAQYEQHVANANAASGALQLLDELLADWEEEDEAAQEEEVLK